ncbi:MAG: response regulator [Kiritimatiellae bacterium]|nr:response regulator [Kiritimatiellia bacterium]
MRILILDDDWELLEVMAKMLSRAEHEVDCSNSALKAVEMVAQKNYDFVLVDYKMPDNDGIWFMKNANLPRSTRTLLITAFVNRDIINKMFAMGASGYIIKPFSEDELFHHIKFYADTSLSFVSKSSD